MKPKFKIILIHGAGLNKSIWDELIPKLNYNCIAVDLPDRGDDTSYLSLDNYAESVIKQIQIEENENIILVGHSVGSIVALKIISELKNQVIGFVGISCLIPNNTGSFVSSLPFPQSIIMPIILSLAGTKPTNDAIRSNLGKDLTEVQINNVIDNFTPESKNLYFGHVVNTIKHLPSLYIITTKDSEMTSQLQSKMADNLNAKYIEYIASGHLPMITHSNELALMINKFANNIEVEVKS